MTRGLRSVDSTLLATLREQTLSVWEEVIGRDTAVALLDVPNQRNAGDSLIWAGEREYLARLGCRVAYTSDLSSFDADRLRRAMPEGVILMHGGGNFGDIWFGHQAHRERIARQMRDYRIVCLPQTVYFGSRDRAQIANDALSSHPDLTLLVRDRPSAIRACEQLPDIAVRFCPDAALGAPISPSRRRSRARRILVLARKDREGSSSLDQRSAEWLPGRRVVIADWAPSGPRAVLWAASRKVLLVELRLRRFTRTGIPARVADASAAGALALINRLNVSMARALFRRADYLIADRLHAHILASLLGMSHVVLDNSYGKVRAIFDDYTGSFTTAQFADDLDDARGHALEETL